MYSIDSIERNGARVHFINIPATSLDAPILFMGHGFPDNSFGWDKQIEAFRGKFHIIAPFMHGTLNNEEVREDRIQFSELLRDVKAILESVQSSPETKIILLGHDLGCFLNHAVYEIYSARVLGIVNLNGLPLPQYVRRKGSLKQWMKSYYILLAQLPIVRAVVKRYYPNYFLKVVYNLSLLSENDEIRGNDQRVFASITIYKLLFRKAIALLAQKPRKVRAPSVFIWGNKDAFLNIPTQDEVDQFHHQGVIRVIRGGHWINRSNSDQVNRILAFTFESWYSTRAVLEQVV